MYARDGKKPAEPIHLVDESDANGRVGSFIHRFAQKISAKIK